MCAGAGAQVTVVTATAPTVVFVASPKTIGGGGSSTLSWSTANATSVTISPGIGAAAVSGSKSVKPAATTTYTLTAKGAGGTRTATATVTVTSATTVTMTALPTTVASGGASTLTVTVTNASSVYISNNVNGTVIPVSAAGGSVVVKPTQTTLYTATVTGSKNNATATATVTVLAGKPVVSITASPAAISSGGTSTLTVTATRATKVVVTNSSDATSYSLGATGGSQSVSPTQTTTYTATATGAGGTTAATATVTVSTGNAQSIQHVLFMLQENRSFDSYFGMLNPYRMNNGWNVGDDGKVYDVDGIDDKLSTTQNVNDEGAAFGLFKTKSSCLDDMTSAWLESYGDVNRYDFSTTRKILMDGFVHVAENYAKFGGGSGAFTDTAGQRAMAYYDEGLLNYYYYMASQFALSDRWFSPISSKSTPNRIATLTGGTTQGLVRDPGVDDRLPQLGAQTIFQKLSGAGVSWKVYYSATNDGCDVRLGSACKPATVNRYPSTTFGNFGYANSFLYSKNSAAPTCTGTTTDSGTAVGDPNNAFCIDVTKIAPVTQLFTDMKNGTLPSFAYIEAGYGSNDEHPGSGQSILQGQAAVAQILNALMGSASWGSSAFFLSYDEGGGPYDHVPPVAGHTNDFTSAGLGVTTDIASIAVNADGYEPCLPAVAGVPTTHCDLVTSDPGAKATDAAAVNGFQAQLGFRLPNMIVSPFARRHYVSHTPMDHTAVIKFVESRFIGAGASLTARDAAQPDLLEFFDFARIPWGTPPVPPAPVTDAAGSTCTPASMGP